jgi:Uma2 family endonuclease
MSATIAPERVQQRDEAVTIRVRDYQAYATISDALDERPGARLIYCDGGLTFLGTSRLHDRYGERLVNLIQNLANSFEITWEDAGRATFRREDMDVGLEGDGTFYFDEHAEIMKGPVNIDLSVQPPPDLAFEIEVSRSADKARMVYGRLGVPEVWRFDAEAWTLGFWQRCEDGTYAEAPRSRFLPMIDAADILAQLRLSDELGSSAWYRQLMDWIRDVLVPRQAGGG